MILNPSKKRPAMPRLLARQCKAPDSSRKQIDKSRTPEGKPRFGNVICRYLAWRPGKFPARQDVKMEMKNILAGRRPIVDHKTESVIDSLVSGNLPRLDHQMAEQTVILSRAVRQFGYRLFGNQQKMNRRLRINILEGQAKVVFVHNIGGNFAVDDLRKNCFSHNPFSFINN
jgi:hypothetical protein